MPSPFTGSAEEQKRFKQHSSPKAFEYYMKEIEKIKNEAPRPSPTPMASSPTAIPATTRLAASAASPKQATKQPFASSARSSPNPSQPNQSTNQSDQSNLSINPIHSINPSNPIYPTNTVNPINQSANPTHPPAPAQLAAQAEMQQQMADMRVLMADMQRGVEKLKFALAEKEKRNSSMANVIEALKSTAVSQAIQINSLRAQLQTAASVCTSTGSSEATQSTGMWYPLSTSTNSAVSVMTSAVSVIDEFIKSYSCNMTQGGTWSHNFIPPIPMVTKIVPANPVDPFRDKMH